MESHLVLILEQNWALLDGSLDGSNYVNLEGLFLEVHWGILMVSCLSPIKASNWDLLMVKCLAI